MEEEKITWSSILELSDVGAWELDPEKSTIHFSDVFRRILEIKEDTPMALAEFLNYFQAKWRHILGKCFHDLLQNNAAFSLKAYDQNGKELILKGKAILSEERKCRFAGTLMATGEPEGVSNRPPELLQNTLYEHIFINSPMPMIIWDFETLEITDCNHQAILKYGYSREEFIGMNIRDIRPEEDIPLLEKYTADEESYANIYQQIWRHKTKSGKLLTVEITGHLIEYKGRKCSLVLINDISDRIEAEEQLLESLRELSDYRFALDESCIIMICDNQGKIAYINQKFEELSEYKARSLIGKDLQDLFPAEEKAKIQACWEIVSANEVWQGELKGKKASGGFYWTNTAVVPFLNNSGDPYQYIWVGSDITAKKRADNELVKERFLLRTIIDNLPIQIYVKDQKGRHIINNKHLYQDLLGAGTEKETLGKTVFDYFDKDTAAKMIAFDRHLIKTKKPVINLEEYYTDAEGKKRCLLTNKVPLLDDEDNVIGLVGMSRDVTDRKKEEEKLKELNEELKKQAKELAVSNQELEQFAYMASHDLQEPLRMITGFLNLLEKKYNPILDEKGKKYIHFAVDGASRMKNIILDLLAYSRVGRKEEKFREIEVADVVANIINLNKVLIHQKKAKITTGKLPKVYIASSPLQQVFQNLVNNALKYQKPEVIPEIVIESEERDDEWCFSVQDNGIGIPASKQEQVFVLFKRLHTRDEYSGSGIGLTMCKKIIENLGGKIWFTSEEGKGSTFYFTIPKTGPEPAP
ncbi:PAS domain-containing sensor histidine kinase [Negadavirga shengliensis]|uniref:histidine kinase n=1 Tax=Negadavirga shengliensis TaxID=1389218 RepID=A0ABV9SVY1_9BACT